MCMYMGVIFLVCSAMVRGKVVVLDVMKEVDKGLSFSAFFCANFDCNKYLLLEVCLAHNGYGKN